MVRISPRSDWIRRVRRDSQTREYVRTRKTPNTDSFHALESSNNINVSVIKKDNFTWVTLFKSSYQRCSLKKVFLKIRVIHRKTPMIESLFNTLAGLKACVSIIFKFYCATLFKRDSGTSIFLWILRNF